ncbi:hypothetical protein GOP47_0008569 [Adiantum capillus-veneris]|nr:hypothetical protein GOP47_0008569 [Adiantum capillus-veneris]
MVVTTIVVSFVARFLLPPSSFPADNEDRLLQGAELQAGVDFAGPESLAFDPQGRGPYTGVADGRILRWDGPSLGWTDFSTTSPNRTDACKPGKTPMMDLSLEPLCGRPLGLRFGAEGELYIADAYYGLMVVGPNGGPATSLVSHVGGKPVLFPNDVDIGEDVIYFTDSSTKFQKNQFLLIFLQGDGSGRLLSYKPSTGETKVVISDLYFPNGIAISRDKSFLLVCETLKQRVIRYWIQGPKAGMVEEFAALPGLPDNIRLTGKDDFWVAIHAQPNWIMRLPILLRRALLKLPIPFGEWYINMARKEAKGMVVKLNTNGKIIEVLEDRQGKVAKLLSGVEERDGVLWLGSVVLPQIVKYNLPR